MIKTTLLGKGLYMLKNNRRMMYIVLSGIITCVLMLIIFWLHGFQPFGVKTLACDDAYIQYLDFYSYFKDVVAGKNSILYSFGKTLGGTNIAVFSYYLSSPFVWLTLLFSKSQLNTYFNISVLLKLTLASMTFCYYLFKRFEGKVDNRYKKLLVILLSVAYSLSQYSVAQASNVMWLDGVYMLPLILLGVYNVVNSKGGWKLSAVIGYSIIANWYIAGINCLFSGIWFLVEYFLNRNKNIY